MKRKIFMILALLCAFAQGAWAQNEWDEVYALTQTTSANWTPLNAGSATGQTLGSAGATSYYYITGDLNFANSNAGGSGLKIQGTVYLYIPSGKTLATTGANASGQTGAGAGIELAAGNTLYLVGGGTLNATGGNAANGGNGGNGSNAECTYDESILGGSGGNGGNGGGGAGAGIGTRGANGGNGGTGGQRNGAYGQETTQYGVDGNAGNAGSTAGAMGNLYLVTSSFNLSATGGSAGSNGTGGNRGLTASQHPGSNVYMASGGGGGGAGGFGGAASNIGTGGPGGGGGGGGAAGNVAWVVYTGTANGYYHAGAKGGHGGTNGNNTSAPDGTSIELDNPKHADIQAGGLRDDASDYDDDDGWENGNAWHDGGAGGDCGYISLALWPFEGAGSDDNPYLINNVYEWNTFAVNVSSGNSYSGQYVQLAADISVTTMAGSSFSGTFDGGDHTITANISGTGSKALFNRIDGGTIQNLKLAGNVSGGIHTAALVVSLGNSGANLIQNCVVSANVTCSGSHMGGFLAHGNTSNITINCCVFSGKMTGGSSAKGVFYGWGDASGTSRVTNCLYLMADGQDLTGLDLVHLNGATTLVDRCYKNTATGSYGTQATVSTEAPGCSGNLMYDCSIVKAYQGAILYGGNYYYDNHALYNHGGYDPYNMFYNFVSGNPNTRTVYTVYSDITWSNRMIIENDVVIYLAEGATLHAQKGIQVSTLWHGYPMNSNLTIDGPGTLIIDGCDNGKSGIGAQALGSITINGGTINVKGGGAGAGIGNDAEPVSGGTITINGGIINATGGTYDWRPNGVLYYRGGAGIGGGAFDTTQGINVTINGGVVNARGGYYASGIGGGAGNGRTDQGKCGTITINGGQVTAIGGEDAPGIGPGYVYANGNPASGTLTLSWTNQYEDFVSSSQFRNLQSISFATGKQFLIDGTSTIATSDNIGGQGIRLVPYVTEPVTLTGAGTAENPWRITCTEDWNKLVYNVNAGNSYSGQYVQLDVDIDITRGMGVYNENPDSAHPFSGTFLGNNKTITATITDYNQGAAPFRYIDGATIKDLKVAGAIASSNRHAAALVGFSDGTGNSIENCVVTADVSGNEYVGGIVGHALNGSISLSGCAFSGLMTGGSTYMGAFIGWDGGGTKTATDCLYLIPVGQSTTNLDLVKEGGTLTVTNCCKTTYVGNYGMYAVYATTPSDLGALTHDYGMVKAYEGGILFDGKYYLATFPGTGTEADPYLIRDDYDWNTFAYDVNNGKNYSGKFVRLDADIDISTTVGLRGDKPFSGTFLGNRHTLTTNISSTTTGTGVNEQGVAPFHYINGATIKDLTMAGTIASASYHTSGLVGFADGTNLIENCIVTATLDISSDYAGGIVGHGQGSTTTIRGCVFAGTINGVDDDRSNIGGIWGWSSDATPTLVNCLEAGTYTNIASMHPMGLQSASGTITNCYYVNPQVGEPSNACTVSGAYRAYTVNTVDGEMLRPLVLVDGNTYYTPCLIAVDDHYNRTGSSVGVTPVVTASDGTSLTLGTDYTATLNGEAVAAFPIDITTLGSKTFTITGLGNCNGSKSANFIVYGVNGEGTEESPYLISDDLEWASFAFYVNSGNSYSGKFVGLDADISVSEMAGSSETYSFQGTFLGNGHTLTFTKGSAESAFDEEYCAPFRHVKNATIQDLKVAGDIYTSRKFTAGLVAHSYGTTNITDCQVGTFIHSILNGDGTHGGIVSMPSGTLNIEGCAYTGRLLTNNGTNNCSGFVGWSGQNTAIVITNSLYDPSGDIPSGWSAINHGATFVYGNRGNITNCYYTETMVSAQGTLVCALSATSPTNLGELVWEYDVLKAYKNGILFNGTYYIGPAIFSGTGTSGNPYLISNDYEWRSLASHVNNGNDFSGKFVKLNANIDITTPVGSRASDSDNKPFSGTFLGDGHTITAALDDDGNQGLALFRYINGATIRDLKVAGTIASSQYHTSGLVGFADGTNLIENCAVTATLDISSDYAGGIVGHGRTSTTTIRGCAFAGTINGVDGDRSNIGGIWGWSTSGTPALVNCMEAGTYTNIASMHPMGLQGGSGTITNCFYVTPQIGNPTNACTVSGASQTYSITPGDYVTVANAGAVSNEYSVSGLTFYEAAGFKYNDVLYAASGDAVILNLNSSASSAEYHVSAGTLSGSENPYTLTMPGENVVINMHALQDIGTTVWYAIATPMHDEDQDHESISGVTNLTTDNYDLLLYDETTGTWKNQKANGGATGFSTLEPGRGYIYRCSAPRTLTYTGVPNNKESYSVSLTASDAAGDLKGFNLVGNPYPFSVTMYRPFYSLGADGIWQAHASGESLEAGQGALVYATNNETLTFYAATRSTNPGTIGALPPLPKALCLGGNGDDPSNHAISQSVNLPFAHQDGNSIVVTGTGTLQAYDIMGRLLFRMELNTEHLTLNTSLFPSAGVYLLRLGDKSQKIVIR